MEVMANEPDWSAERIHDHLAGALQEELGHDGLEGRLPSIRTIGRWKRELSSADLADYQYVRWPETFEAGLLPWGSSPDVLELRAMTEQVTVRRARWWWRLVQAAPDVPKTDARLMSAYLAVNEAAGGIPDFLARAVEWYLALRGWEDADAYGRRLEELSTPVERWLTLGLAARAMPEGVSPAVLAERGSQL